MLTYRPGNPGVYYRKRFLAIFPMFWLAYIAASAVDLFLYRGFGTGNLAYLVFSLLGMDGYLATLGIIGYDFYKLGEWFLGCLLLLYLLFPLLYFAFTRHPVMTAAFCCALYVLYALLSRLGIVSFRSTLFFLRIPELLAGMAFTRFDLRHKPRLLAWIAAGAICAVFLTYRFVYSLTLAITVCSCLFALLTFLGEHLSFVPIRRLLTRLAALTYPVFLTHHYLISRIASLFDLSAMSRRTCIALYAVYLLASLLLAEALRICTERATGFVCGLFRAET